MGLALGRCWAAKRCVHCCPVEKFRQLGCPEATALRDEVKVLLDDLAFFPVLPAQLQGSSEGHVDHCVPSLLLNIVDGCSGREPLRNIGTEVAEARLNELLHFFPVVLHPLQFLPGAINAVLVSIFIDELLDATQEVHEPRMIWRLSGEAARKKAAPRARLDLMYLLGRHLLLLAIVLLGSGSVSYTAAQREGAGLSNGNAAGGKEGG